jgi:hypothetical protein
MGYSVLFAEHILNRNQLMSIINKDNHCDMDLITTLYSTLKTLDFPRPPHASLQMLAQCS